MKKTILIWLLLCATVFAKPNIDVCFTPGGNCDEQIINAINHAKLQILVQAYSFTNYQIANALIDARKRNVYVNVLLDKTQLSSKRSVYNCLNKHNVETHIDYTPAIAHNKVMLIDNKIVITGSYNFTEDAQNRNTENLLIIYDKKIAALYFNNWMRRYELSE